MKQFILLITVFSVTASLIAQTAERTLVKSYDLKGCNAIVADLQGDVSVEPWSQDVFRIETSIRIDGVTSTAVKKFVAQGRYYIKSTDSNGTLVLSMPRFKTGLKAFGVELDQNETITYKIYAPEYISVTLAEDAQTHVQ